MYTKVENDFFILVFWAIQIFRMMECCDVLCDAFIVSGTTCDKIAQVQQPTW